MECFIQHNGLGLHEIGWVRRMAFAAEMRAPCNNIPRDRLCLVGQESNLTGIDTRFKLFSATNIHN